MPFCELHPLNYTIQHYTKGDLFSMLYASFSILYAPSLDVQTLSPKGYSGYNQEGKKTASYSTKVKAFRSIQHLFSSSLNFDLEQDLFPRRGKCSVSLEKALPRRVHIRLICI